MKKFVIILLLILGLNNISFSQYYEEEYEYYYTPSLYGFYLNTVPPPYLYYGYSHSYMNYYWWFWGCPYNPMCSYWYGWGWQYNYWAYYQSYNWYSYYNNVYYSPRTNNSSNINGDRNKQYNYYSKPQINKKPIGISPNINKPKVYEKTRTNTNNKGRNTNHVERRK